MRTPPLSDGSADSTSAPQTSVEPKRFEGNSAVAGTPAAAGNNRGFGLIGTLHYQLRTKVGSRAVAALRLLPLPLPVTVCGMTRPLRTPQTPQQNHRKPLVKGRQDARPGMSHRNPPSGTPVLIPPAHRSQDLWGRPAGQSCEAIAAAPVGRARSGGRRLDNRARRRRLPAAQSA